MNEHETRAAIEALAKRGDRVQVPVETAPQTNEPLIDDEQEDA